MKNIYSYVFILKVTFVFLVASAFYVPDTSTIKETLISPITDEIVTDNLYYAAFYDFIFRGHFEHLEITTEDPEFLMIFGAYLNAYGTQCSEYLPANKVEMQKQVCKTERVTTDGFGIETNRTCIEYVWVGSGIYARSDLYNAKIKVENAHRAKGMQTIIEMVTDPNALGNSVDMAHKNAGLKSDMDQIFKLNDGNGVVIKKFEENLKRFALNDPSIRLDKASKYAIMKESGGPTAPQNQEKLLNDLVLNQSKTWSFNRYKDGSIYNIADRRDKRGKIHQIYANYLFTSFGGEKKGNVIVKFKNGLPDCIYFFDFPDNCKTPNSTIVASFANGDYTVE